MTWNKRAKQDLLGQPENIYPAALAYLTRRDYGVEELRQRLLLRGADPELTEDTIQRLLRQKYLDDRRFALGRVRQRREFNGRSRVFVRQELRELGIDEELIQQALDEAYQPEQESELLEHLLRAELRRFPREGDSQQQRKATASIQRRLAAKGFPPGEVYQTLRRLLDTLEEE